MHDRNSGRLIITKYLPFLYGICHECVEHLQSSFHTPYKLACEILLNNALQRASFSLSSPSLLRRSNVFSVNVLARVLCSRAFNITFSTPAPNCRLYASTKFRNRSGICSSTSVSGGDSIRSNRNDIKSTPRCSRKLHITITTQQPEQSSFEFFVIILTKLSIHPHVRTFSSYDNKYNFSLIKNNIHKQKNLNTVQNGLC